mgnify:CR=1 FL=1
MITWLITTFLVAAIMGINTFWGIVLVAICVAFALVVLSVLTLLTGLWLAKKANKDINAMVNNFVQSIRQREEELLKSADFEVKTT